MPGFMLGDTQPLKVVVGRYFESRPNTILSYLLIQKRERLNTNAIGIRENSFEWIQQIAASERAALRAEPTDPVLKLKLFDKDVEIKVPVNEMEKLSKSVEEIK